MPLTRPVRLGSEVYEHLLQKLMSLEIEPGERIAVDRLVRELGVSQTPVREALHQLEAQGLVEKTHLVGYRAAPQLTSRQFEDLCELRLLIEPAAASKAAVAMSSEELQELTAFSAEMDEPGGTTSRAAYNAFARKDAEFHALIAAGSGNALIHQTIVQQRTHLHLFRLRFHAQVTLEAMAEHAHIVAALGKRDAEGAAAAMRTHIERAHARFQRTVFS